MEKANNLPKLQFDRRRSRVKVCPCGKSNKDGKFSPFVGYESKGHCHSCGKTYLPDRSFKEAPHWVSFRESPGSEKSRPISYLPVEIFKQSLQTYEENHLVKYLNDQFGKDISDDLIRKYFVGSSSHWTGSTVFYQIDLKGNIRGGKIMLYEPLTGKRVKEPFNHIAWMHSVLKLPGYTLKQCLFGEHLLRDNTKKIALVESEKTAIIASAYFPQFLWLATGGKGNLNLRQCQALKGRTVLVFPDVKGLTEWEGKAKELSHFANFIISKLWEQRATDKEREQSLDLADYLIRSGVDEFRRNWVGPKPIRDHSIELLPPIKRDFQTKTPPFNFDAIEHNKGMGLETANEQNGNPT